MSKLVEYITNDGYDLLARMLSGFCTIDFTKIQMGDGAAAASDYRRATHLTHVCATLPVDRVEVESTQTVTVTANFSNEGQETGFYYKEKGVFATDGTTEILFSYAYSQEGTWIPPYTEEIIEKRIKTICTQLQEVQGTINILVKSGIYATTEDLDVVAGDLQNLVDSLKSVAFSNSYTDLDDLPTLGTAAERDVPASGNAGNGEVVLGNDSRLSDARNASDVYAWAKESTKPSYNKSEVGLGNVDNTSDADKPISTATQAALNGKLASTLKGAANGLAELDAYGKVPAAQLPSYVDDVIEGYYYNNKFYKEAAHTTEITGESGKIYIDVSTNKEYRWSGSVFAVISETLSLGETSSTAYRGDRGKTAYDHSQSDHGSIKPAFTEASTRANIASGETLATILGKIKKYFTDLGTAAFKNVPSSGNAGNDQVVLGNDSRLTNARTPSSHAANSTTYGGGTSSNYGHVKLTDTYNTQQSSVAAANSVGASAKAVQDAYNELNSNIKYIDVSGANVNNQYGTGDCYYYDYFIPDYVALYGHPISIYVLWSSAMHPETYIQYHASEKKVRIYRVGAGIGQASFRIVFAANKVDITPS